MSTVQAHMGKLVFGSAGRCGSIFSLSEQTLWTQKNEAWQPERDRWLTDLPLVLMAAVLSDSTLNVINPEPNDVITFLLRSAPIPPSTPPTPTPSNQPCRADKVLYTHMNAKSDPGPPSSGDFVDIIYKHTPKHRDISRLTHLPAFNNCSARFKAQDQKSPQLRTADVWLD